MFHHFMYTCQFTYVPKKSYIYVEEYINYYSLHDLFLLNRGGQQKSFHALCTQTFNTPHIKSWIPQ